MGYQGDHAEKNAIMRGGDYGSVTKISVMPASVGFYGQFGPFGSGNFV